MDVVEVAASLAKHMVAMKNHGFWLFVGLI